jgi:protein-disulfide isomerase
MKGEQHSHRAGAVIQNALPLLCCLAIGVLLGVIVYGFGQQHQRDISDLRKEISALNAGQVAVGKDVGEIRDLLRRQPAQGGPAAPPRDIVLSLGNAPFKGNANATVTLVEFTDYQCGFCARHVKETFPQLERDYIATGKVKYVFRNFPLESIHQQSFKAHEASTCASDQGKFWEMHDRLFANQTALAPEQLIDYARTLGLNTDKFQACFNGESHKQQIQNDIAEGQKAGVTGTPTFFLGRTVPNSQTLKVARTVVGAKAYSAFKEEIDALLAAAPSS